MEKGYASYTIVDLLDTATYIYYAEAYNNNTPEGITKIPSEKSLYIGIYSGPALSTQPDVNSEEYNDISKKIEWSRYVGDGFDSPTYRYAQSQDGENPPDADDTEIWKPKPFAPNPGWYLWAEQTLPYLDKTKDPIVSYSVSYSGEDGEDANYYVVELSTEEIVKFNTEKGLNFSPSSFYFEVYDIRDDKKDKVDLSESEREWEMILTFYHGPNYENYETFDDPVFQKTEISEGQIHPEFIHRRTLYLTNLLLYKSLLETEEGVFHIKLTPKDGPSIIKLVNYRYGIQSDLATFNIHAAGFNSVINDKKLSFEDGGLQLTNVGISAIKVKDGVQITAFEITKDGDVYFNDGYFSGDISAATGTFSGGLSANYGDIGGFQIKDNCLYTATYTQTLDETPDSNKKYYYTDSNGKWYLFEGSSFIQNVIYYTMNESETSSPLILYGEEGKIIANTIELGTGATISDYIDLGGAALYNPDKHDGLVLKSGAINLNNEGVFKIGNIIADGSGSGSIRAYDENGFSSWEIQGDGTANFNDIYADNVHLANTILQIGTVQSVGSLMLFKDSWTVSKIEGANITIDGSTTLKVDDWIYTGEKVYKIEGVTENKENNLVTSTEITIGTSEHNITEQSVVTKFGQNDDYIISILGSSSKNDNNLWKFAKGNSLTISNFTPINDSTTYGDANNALQYQPRLVLGSLDAINNVIGVTNPGIGLYADNVFLNGSLTTIINSDSFGNKTYAGVNTINSVEAEVFENDNSKIVFWAGSTGTGDEIKSAYFQVTEKGSLYASQGLFTGSIITESIIEGAKIKASEIWGSDETNCLKIYDANSQYGIGFYSSKGTLTDPSDDFEVLRITSEGLSIIDNKLPKSIIKINNGQAAFFGQEYSGSKFIADSGSISSMILDSQGLGYSPVYDTNQLNIQTKITFDESSVKISANKNIGLEVWENNIKIGNLIEINTNNNEKEIIFGDRNKQNTKMFYREMINGFDLYIG